jgi:hypothetical protein
MDTNPSVWLEDYRLTCHTGRATDDLFIIKNLPLYLGDSARTWLEHLPRGKINDWTDLRRVFIGNFQGTYAHPRQAMGAAQLQAAAGGKPVRLHLAFLQMLHRAPWCDGQ